MRRWLTITLGSLVLSCQGPAAVLAREAALASLVTGMDSPQASAAKRADADQAPAFTGCCAIQSARGRHAPC